MLVLAVAIGLGRFAFTPILPMMQEDYNVSLRLAGWLASANYLGYLLGALSAVWLRYSAPMMIIVSLALISATTIGMGLIHDPAVWLILRFVAGVASAWALIFASSWIFSILAQLGRSALGGLMFGGVGLGTCLAGLACMAFLLLTWSSDQAWIVLGVSAALLTLFIRLLYRRPEFQVADTRLGQSRSNSASAAIKPYWVLILCYGLFGFAYIIPGTFLPAMAKALLPDPLLFGWAWPVFGLAALTSTLLAGYLSARFAHRAIWAVSHLVMAFGLVLPIVAPNLIGILLCALGVGGTFVVATLSGLQEARRITPDNAQSLMAAMTSAFALGQIFGPLLIALLGQAYFASLFIVAAIGVGGSGLVLLWPAKTGRVA